MKITEELLIKHGACEPAIKRFSETFPDGVEPTEEMAELHGGDFHGPWAGDRLLRAAYRSEFTEQEWPLWRAYIAALEQVRVHGYAVDALYLGNEIGAPEWHHAYDAAVKEKRAAWREYRVQVAKLFVKLWRKQCDAAH